MKLAVVGKNIGYSQSPFIHSEFAKALGLAMDYSIQDVGEGSFQEVIKSLRDQGFHGCNITVPYKEEAFALSDEKSLAAKEAGAANTFVFCEDGSIFADNTDGIGLVRDISQNLGFSLHGKRILICGAGGAVRGILGPLLQEKPDAITIANRNIQKCEDLVKRFAAVRAFSYEALHDQVFDVVIDGTSLKNEALPLPPSLALSTGALVYDLKYSVDGLSPIMQWGKRKGAASIHDGIGMLVEQAAQAFQIWTHQKPDTKPVIAKLKALYQK